MTIPFMNNKETMENIKNHSLNPLIDRVSKYSQASVDAGQRYTIDHRAFQFSSSGGRHIGFPINGLESDEYVVRAVVAETVASAATIQTLTPCSDIRVDRKTHIMSAEMEREVPNGHIMLEVWKELKNSSTPTIPTFTGKTELRKVRTDSLNPTMARALTFTRDLVEDGVKCAVDHRSLDFTAKGSIASMTLTLPEGAYPVRASVRWDGDPDSLYYPCPSIDWTDSTNRVSITHGAPLNTKGTLYVEYWKALMTSDTPSFDEITVGDRKQNIRENLFNMVIEKVNQHTQEILGMATHKKHTVDYRSYAFEHAGPMISFPIPLDPDEQPVRAVKMTYDAAEDSDVASPCPIVAYDRAKQTLTVDIGDDDEGLVFVEFWKQV